MTKLSVRLLGVPVLLGSLALAACGAKGNAPGEGQGNDPSAVAQGEHGGPGKMPFLNAVLRLDDLSSDQRAKVMTIADEYQKATAPRRVAGAALAELYAKALDTGKMDDAAVDAKLAELETLATTEKAALATALDSLHATLTPEQRTALVESLAHRHHKGPFGGGKHHDHDGKMGGGKGGMHGPLRHMMKDLDLTDAQKQAFEDKLSEPKPVWDHAGNMANLKALGDAFQTNDFSAKSHDLGMLGGPSPAKFATKMRQVIKVSIEVLDAGQRAKMAAKIRDFAAKMS